MKDSLYEKRYTVARLLSMISGEEGGSSEHSFNAIQPLKGRIMMHGTVYSWLATPAGYWMVQIMGTEKIPLYKETCFVVNIMPSFERVQIWAYPVTPEDYTKFEKAYRTFFKKVKGTMDRMMKQLKTSRRKD